MSEDTREQAAGTCTRCSGVLRGPHCHQCGEPAEPPRLDEARIARDLLGSLFNIDGRLWLTVRHALTRPGRMAREYCWGLRWKYIGPTRVVLVLLMLLYGAASGLGLTEGTIDYEESDAFTGGAMMAEWGFRHPHVSLFLNLPILAFTAGLVFRRPRTTFGERFTLVTYLAVQWLVLIVALVVLGALAPTWLAERVLPWMWDGPLAALGLAATLFLSQVAVFALAARDFYGLKLGAATWRACLAILGWYLADLAAVVLAARFAFASG